MSHLRSLLPAGLRVERYGREWRVGPLTGHKGSLTGKLGFQRATGAGELWDEVKNDFVPKVLLEGATSPFAIRTSGGPPWRVAFQLRSGVIKRTSFTGALEALLRQSSGSDEWRVEPDTDEMSFDEWRSRVGRIAEVRLRLNRPNPHYADDEQVENLIEGARARMASVVLQTDDPRGLDVDSVFVSQALDHVNREYGYFTVKAEHAGGILSFDSRTDASPPERQFPADPESGEVGPSHLRDAVGDDPDGE